MGEDGECGVLSTIVGVYGMSNKVIKHDQTRWGSNHIKTTKSHYVSLLFITHTAAPNNSRGSTNPLMIC